MGYESFVICEPELFDDIVVCLLNKPLMRIKLPERVLLDANTSHAKPRPRNTNNKDY